MKALFVVLFMFMSCTVYSQSYCWFNDGDDLLLVDSVSSDTLTLKKISWTYENSQFYYFIEFKEKCDYSNYPNIECYKEILVKTESMFEEYLKENPILEPYARNSEKVSQ